MSNTFHEEIKKEVERVGFNLVATKPTKDDNIKSVHAFCEKRKEYVTWIYNVSMGGLYNGHYFSYRYDDRERMRQLSYEDWDNRK